jgi:hypothetical protein
VAQQAANNGPSQAASTKAVTFSRQSAQRIAKVVRTVEAGNRDQPGIVFDHPQPNLGNAKVFRVATFTGAWDINASKTVTFKNQTATPNTVSASNLFFDFPEPSGTVDCGIAKEGTAWYVVSVPITSVTQQLIDGGDYDNVEVVTDISISASLSTADCSITVNKTLTTQTVLLPVSGSTYTASVLIFKVD